MESKTVEEVLDYLTLFAYLKLRRGTDIDIADVKKALPHCPEGFDEKKFMAWSDKGLIARLKKHKKDLGL